MVGQKIGIGSGKRCVTCYGYGGINKITRMIMSDLIIKWRG